MITAELALSERTWRFWRWPAWEIAAVIIASASLLLGIAAFLATRNQDNALNDKSSSLLTGSPCREGTSAGDVIEVTPSLDDSGASVYPPRTFDQINGSARFGQQDGRTYHWARVGSDDQDRVAGGALIRWRVAGTVWHDCHVELGPADPEWVYTPAVAATLAGHPIEYEVCLWRKDPQRSSCTGRLKAAPMPQSS
jgi:hypothetical protein